jgi:hypothetical protein
MRAFLILLFMILPNALTAAVIREAVRGEVDLRDWNGADALRIYGDWHFFPNELLTPAEAQQRFDQSVGYLKPGQPFRKFTGTQLSNLGYGSYLVRVQSPCQRCRIHFALPQLYVAGNIFVFDDEAANDVLPLFELGKVGRQALQEKPQVGTALTPAFEVKDQSRFYIIVQVSNIHN